MDKQLVSGAGYGRQADKFLISFIFISRGGVIGGLSALTEQALAYRAIPISGNCSVQTLYIPTLKIGNIFNIPPIVSSVNFSCTPKTVAPPNLKNGDYVTYCWHIHNGGGGRDYNTNGYRGAVNGTNVIWFNFYGNHINLGSVPVGTIQRPYNIYGYAKQTGDNTWTVDDPVTLKFEHNEGSLSLPAGHYTYTNPELHVGMSVLSKNEAFNKKSACAGGDTSDSSYSNEIGSGGPYAAAHVDLNIETYCQAKADPMNFGKTPNLLKPLTASANVYVDCSAGTDFEATIDNGLHFSGGTRRMEREKTDVNDNTDDAYITYSITPVKWSGVGKGTGLDLGNVEQIDGTVPVQPVNSAGTYKDTLLITLTYRNIFPTQNTRQGGGGGN